MKNVLLLIAFLCFFVQLNAQAFQEPAGRKTLSLTLSGGAAFPVGIADYNAGATSSLSLNYSSKAGTFNLLYAGNFLYAPKSSTSIFNFILMNNYGVGYSYNFLPSKKLFTTLDISYSEVEYIITSVKTPKYTGANIGLTIGYTFWAMKKGAFSVSANYHYANLQSKNFSNAGLGLHYSFPLKIWKE